LIKKKKENGADEEEGIEQIRKVNPAHRIKLINRPGEPGKTPVAPSKSRPIPK
jgi:hypothetical protein